MDATDEAPAAPSALPPDAIDILDQLDEAALRAAINYAQARYRYLHPNVTDQIEPAPGEEIVRIEERPEYTEVVKRQPCAEGCDECPHGPHLYRVQEERYPDDSTSLHWTYLGRVVE